MAQRFLSWEEASRGTWGTQAYKDGATLPFEYDKVGVGALQRIAASLELIANLLDPEKQQERSEQQQKKKAFSNYGDALDEIEDKAFGLLKPFPTTGHREAAKTASRRLARCFLRAIGNASEFTSEDVVKAREIASSLTIGSVHWETLKLGPKAKPRLLELVEAARLRAAESGTG